MGNIVLAIILGSVVLYLIYEMYKKTDVKRREAYINNYKFPLRISQTLLTTYPHLKVSDVDLIMKGLREYFHVCNMAGKTMVSMPSQAVDVAWHDFILFTRKYESFCQKGLGRFLHHTPAEAMQSKTIAQDSIKVAWNFSCKRENIDVNTPKKLPLLFALDSSLNINDGFKYSLDCRAKNGAAYCAGDIGCSSGCSGDSGDSSFGDSGCGGDSSCGGGCGGGGD